MTGDNEFEGSFEALDLHDAVRRAQFVGHLGLVNTAWKFLETAVRDGDLRRVWDLVHESLRTEWAQQWVIDNRQAIVAAGHHESSVVAGLAEHKPAHELWVHFERVYVRSLRRELPDPTCWGIGANTRVVGADLEALLVHDMSQLPADGVLRPGATSGYVFPLIFRRVGDQWLLAFVGTNQLLNDL
jgi:hypothetical protein